MASSGAHATALTVAGYLFQVNRTFGLICRVEERFGTVRDLSERLGGARLSARDLYDLYRLLLAEAEPAVPREMIEEHVMDVGLARCIQEVTPIIEAFFLGEERFMERVAEKAAGSRPPMPATAASPGGNFSGPPLVSAGSRGSSGAQLSTNSPQPLPRASMRPNGQTAAG